MGNIAFRLRPPNNQANAIAGTPVNPANLVAPVPFNRNLYVNKKHTIQGMPNMSILTTNIPALIRLFDRRNYSDEFIKFFTPSVIFLVLSIIIEALNMAITLWVGVYYDVDNPADEDNAQRLTNLSIVFSALSTVVSIVTVGLGNSPNTTIATIAPTAGPVGNMTRF